jgi:hypothetical protein
MTQEVADTFDGQVSRTIGLRFASVLTPAAKDRGHAITTGFLERGQDPRLVVHDDVVLRRLAPLDIIQRLFRVDVDQHVPIHRLEDARSLDGIMCDRRSRR